MARDPPTWKSMEFLVESSSNSFIKTLRKAIVFAKYTKHLSFNVCCISVEDPHFPLVSDLLLRLVLECSSGLVSFSSMFSSAIDHNFTQLIWHLVKQHSKTLKSFSFAPGRLPTIPVQAIMMLTASTSMEIFFTNCPLTAEIISYMQAGWSDTLQYLSVAGDAFELAQPLGSMLNNCFNLKHLELLNMENVDHLLHFLAVNGIKAPAVHYLLILSESYPIFHEQMRQICRICPKLKTIEVETDKFCYYPENAREDLPSLEYFQLRKEMILEVERIGIKIRWRDLRD